PDRAGARHPPAAQPVAGDRRGHQHRRDAGRQDARQRPADQSGRRPDPRQPVAGHPAARPAGGRRRPSATRREKAMSLAKFDGRHVLVVGQRLAPVAQEALGQARFEIAAADRLDFLGSLHAAMDLVLIDAEAVDPVELVGAISGLAARPTPPAVMLAGAHLPASLVRALMKLPRSDVIEAPFSSDDLARAAAGLIAEPLAAPATTPTVNAVCWTVVGSVGGCGATTIAVELATALAGRPGKDKRVALVDLNLVDGAAAAYLGATPSMTLAEASDSPERIDAALLGAFAMRVGDGLDLLAAPRDPKANARVSQTAVCRMLEVACQVYDWIVIDLPRHQQAWTLD